MSGHILIIEDDVSFATLLMGFLERRKWKVSLVSHARDVKSKLEKNKFDLVLSDYKLPDGDGIDLIKTCLHFQPDVPVIIMTSYNDVKLAVKALKEGAVDYITKPVLPDELLALIENYTDPKRKPESKKEAPPVDTGAAYVKGHSAVMLDIEKHIELVAPTQFSVLILGESGTGKEWAARKIHRLSPRAEKPFLALDCGAINNDLAGSEFFGHVRGAFTGALYEKAGIFELADGGTVFLDEIGNLSHANQVKILRVLQERVVRRIGSDKETPVDVRIISATNEDLRPGSEGSTFREDLYHRLNEFSILLPPLRERGKDIDLYIRHFTKQATKELAKPGMDFTDEAREMLHGYQWPGNLRELKNLIRKCVLLNNDKLIEAERLPLEIRLNTASSDEKTSISGKQNELKKNAMNAERRQILEVLEKCRYNKSEAARVLGIDRKTLYNKIKLLGLDGIIGHTLP